MNDKLLSQSDIDSMVSELAVKAQAAPQENKATSAAAASTATANPALADTGKLPDEPTGVPSVKAITMQDAVPRGKNRMAASPAESVSSNNDKLLERLKRVEEKVQRLEQYERIRSGLGKGPVTPEQFQELLQYVRKLGEDVLSISAKLQGTPGYDIYHTFKCERCGTEKHVAGVYKCTSCGHESLTGWWPQQR